MWNKKIKDIVYKYERLNDWYNVGPIQRAVLEDFACEIVTECAQIAADASMHKLPASSYASLILEEFNFKE